MNFDRTEVPSARSQMGEYEFGSFVVELWEQQVGVLLCKVVVDDQEVNVGR